MEATLEKDDVWLEEGLLRKLASLPIKEVNLVHKEACLINDNDNGNEMEAGSVFEALRYFKPSQTRVIIVGQDPYPAKGVADGLSFSSRAAIKTPASLANIRSCLHHSGLIKTARTKSCDLRPWAMQGVLLLNTSLTCGDKAHRKAWAAVTLDIALKAATLGSANAKKVVAMLWGREAQRWRGPLEEAGAKCLTWTHPSPLADNCLPESKRFKHCDSFAEAAKIHPAICWDLQTPTVLFADGACSGNGKKNARASYAALAVARHIGRMRVWGVVGNVCYDAAVEPIPGSYATMTNNRGEYLAIAQGLAMLARCGVSGPVVVVSDSEIAVKLFQRLTDKRNLQKSTAQKSKRRSDKDLKNLDLVKAVCYGAEALMSRGSALRFVHVRSHLKSPPGDSQIEYLCWKGNRRADALAAAALATEESQPSKHTDRVPFRIT